MNSALAKHKRSHVLHIPRKGQESHGATCVCIGYLATSISSSLPRLNRLRSLRAVNGDLPVTSKLGVWDIPHPLRQRFDAWYLIKWASYSVIMILSLRFSPCRHTSRRQRGGPRRCGRSSSAQRDEVTAYLCGYSTDWVAQNAGPGAPGWDVTAVRTDVPATGLRKSPAWLTSRRVASISYDASWAAVATLLRILVLKQWKLFFIIHSR
jgi:hypothetical protein